MRLLVAAFFSSALFAQPDLSPDALLEGIRQNVRQNLTRLPDYTCRLTVQRSTGREGARRLHVIDTVHIEVGYLDGKELYAWPGQKFENVKLEDMLPAGGTVGTGDFALHLRGIFLNNSAVFTYAGRSLSEGREIVRFQYRVPRSKSLYVLRSGPARQTVVGYEGSFSADARTLLLDRLEIMIDDIPPPLRIRRAGSILTYATARIGEADFLLPHTSELFLVDDSGRENRNETRFDHCHQYSGESVVNFAEATAISAEGPKPIAEIQLPPGMLLEMALGTAVDGRNAAIGDPITGLISHDAGKAGAVIIPKGAKVTGRITRLGQTTRGRVVYQFLGLRMSTLEFPGHRAQFRASLESVAVAAAQTDVGRGSPNEAVLFIKGNSLHIPAGAHMLWRTGKSE